MSESKYRLPQVIGLAMVLSIGSGWLHPANANQTTGRHNKTQNGQGCEVSHGHYGQCLSSGKCVNGATCPTNASCESSFGFSAADRKYSWTNTWNCHGRTFDNRGSWTGTANIFVSCDSGFCPLNPLIGDAILWSSGSVHSVTIKGAWNGLSTKVRSKYGCCGEYEHALSNSTNVYGSGWSVVRFGSSPVFLVGESGGVPFPTNPDELEDVVSTMPWYSTVLASAVEYAVEHPRRVRENGEVSDETRKRLQRTEDPVTRLEVLAEDLRDPAHYSVLALYNHPADAVDFVEGIEAGQVLVKMAQEYPDDLREVVVELLEETALGTQFTDGARAASILFASQILGAEERADLERRVSGSAVETSLAEGQENLVDYYRSEFLLSDSNE